MWADNLFILIWLGWFSSPILIGYAFLESASFFGDMPNPQQLAHARVLSYTGFGCAFGCPVLGMIVASLMGRRSSIWPYAGALAITVAVIGYAALRLHQ